MRRRDFIKAITASATAWPLAARAEQSAMPVIAFLRSTSAAGSEQLVAAFEQGLKETGFVEGQKRSSNAASTPVTETAIINCEGGHGRNSQT